VVAALHAAPEIRGVHAAVSPHTPDTHAHLASMEHVTCIETPGEGYVADIGVALDALSAPVVTSAADLPLLAPEHVSRTVEAHRDADGASVTVCVPTTLKEELGVSADTTRAHGGRELAPTGVNVVGTENEELMTTYDARLAVNVNRLADAAVAEALCD
jgi:adenosylcobinamide-phosphate guanylyltransferase